MVAVCYLARRHLLEASVSPLRERLRRLTRDPKTLSAIGVLAAGFLLAEVNVLAALRYQRWDFSEAEQFTLSSQTRSLARQLEEDVEIIVFLPRADPLAVELRHTLDGYAALSPHIKVRALDPDRDTAEFLALSSKYPLLLGRDEEGTAQPSVALMLLRAERHRYLSRSALSLPEPDGSERSNVESALSEAIVSLSSNEEKTLCFSSGHGERSPQDLGPEGLRELARRAEQANIQTKRLTPEQALETASCDLFAVVGPKTPFSPEDQERLLDLSASGTDFLLLLDPLVSQTGGLVPLGLQTFTESFGLRQLGGFVLEQDERFRLPRGLGESFLAQPRPHSITARLHSEGYRSELHFLATTSQAFELSGAALPLLTASPTAELISDLHSVGETPGQEGAWVIAALSQKAGPEGASKLVAFGFSSLAESSQLLDPALAGNAEVLLGSLAWLSARPAALGIRPGVARPAPLPLTEDSLTALLRYVLVYMPATSVLLGGYLFLRRRRREQLSREDADRKVAS